jgi:hypothetical protein
MGKSDQSKDMLSQAGRWIINVGNAVLNKGMSSGEDGGGYNISDCCTMGKSDQAKDMLSQAGRWMINVGNAVLNKGMSSEDDGGGYNIISCCCSGCFGVVRIMSKRWKESILSILNRWGCVELCDGSNRFAIVFFLSSCLNNETEREALS